MILALEDIQAGDEITITYIDNEGSLAGRSEELRDYGFICQCDKCTAENLAAELHGE